MIVPSAAAAVAVGFVGADLVTPPARGLRSRAGGIFPLCLCRKAVRTLSVSERRPFAVHLFVQPGDVSFGIAPIDAHRGPFGRLRRAWRKSKSALWNTPFHIENGVTGRGLIASVSQEGDELFACDRIFAQRECLDRNDVLRSLVVEPAAFARRAAHDKIARRNADHLRTILAFLEFALPVLLRRRNKADRKEHDESDGDCAGQNRQITNSRKWHRSGLGYAGFANEGPYRW